MTRDRRQVVVSVVSLRWEGQRYQRPDRQITPTRPDDWTCKRKETREKDLEVSTVEEDRSPGRLGNDYPDLGSAGLAAVPQPGQQAKQRESNSIGSVTTGAATAEATKTAAMMATTLKRMMLHTEKREATGSDQYVCDND